MTIGEKIKRIRTDNKLTQQEFADKLYVTRGAVSKWETGSGIPNLESIKLICETFKISIDYLVNTKQLVDELIDKDKEVQELKKTLSERMNISNKLSSKEKINLSCSAIN